MARFFPHVTVAAVVEREQRFLMVAESPEGTGVYNQPAGHLESGESLVEAVVREVREETGFTFRPRHLLGVYRWLNGPRDTTFLRVCFSGFCEEDEPQDRLDPEILATLWMTRAELAAQATRLRSPMVLRCVDDYLAGRAYPLDVLVDLP